jgi:FkbM family methyltransferase
MKALLNLLDFKFRGHQLDGPLAGCRMRGRVLDAYLDGSYEPDVCETIMSIVQRGWICVDVGAHVGYFTLLFAKLVDERGRVIAFEAHPENARQLRFNTRINGYETRVQVENVAISDGISQRVNLFPGRGHSSFEWNIVGHDVEGNPRQPELEVQATSLDAYFTACSCVDFIKIDIEGAEAQALHGMRRLLRETRPFVLVEFHDEKSWTGRRELLTADYRLYDVRNARWLNSELDVGGVYHCLAVPRERMADIRLGGL